jgi:hypothetical protein
LHFPGVMADEMLLDRIQDLSDLELATLICLVAEEHCIIHTDAESRDKLAQELELVSFLGWRLRCKLLMAYRWLQESSASPTL